ncbi:hypothetical protein VTK73DRAFT_5316 [Phialemonium thermophilum]|uniref:Uncharacterized protein n=1 Tax=Phialemonium thermophilum TaxID=223376 RepID=A0ABR3Y8E1_9PEZI
MNCGGSGIRHNCGAFRPFLSVLSALPASVRYSICHHTSSPGIREHMSQRPQNKDSSRAVGISFSTSVSTTRPTSRVPIKETLAGDAPQGTLPYL